MITSRGCPYTCIYCSYPQTIYTHKYRAMSPERVLREIRYLVNELGVKEIRIDDDTFDIVNKRVIEICKLLVKRESRFHLFGAMPPEAVYRGRGTVAEEGWLPDGAVRHRIGE